MELATRAPGLRGEIAARVVWGSSRRQGAAGVSERAEERTTGMDKIRVSAAGAVREVVLARGEKRNALDAEMLDALRNAFAVSPPADERVTVIRAEGPV